MDWCHGLAPRMFDRAALGASSSEPMGVSLDGRRGFVSSSSLSRSMDSAGFVASGEPERDLGESFERLVLNKPEALRESVLPGVALPEG